MPKKSKAIKLTDIKAGKPWLKKVGFTSYNEETKEPNKTFLIVCEGQTEALYFESFPVVSAEVETHGIGCSKTNLVECTIELSSENKYDEVWCVFDMDFKPGQNGQYEDFNNAIQLCENENIKCAYSNDAFELWIYLHYHYNDQKNHRTFYYQQLSDFFNINYEREGKRRKFVLKLYQSLVDDVNASQLDAIARAKTLIKVHDEVTPPHLQNPITHIYLLVEELNLYLFD